VEGAAQDIKEIFVDGGVEVLQEALENEDSGARWVEGVEKLTPSSLLTPKERSQRRRRASIRSRLLHRQSQRRERQITSDAHNRRGRKSNRRARLPTELPQQVVLPQQDTLVTVCLKELYVMPEVEAIRTRIHAGTEDDDLDSSSLVKFGAPPDNNFIYKFGPTGQQISSCFEISIVQQACLRLSWEKLRH
jgi:hypothetical protein